MNDSLFWQKGFPKDRRIELVANLLYADDPNARIPNDEGLQPDRVNDFYATVGFSGAADFESRMEKVWEKYRHADGPAEAEAPRSLPSADPFEKFFTQEKLETPSIDVPIIESVTHPVSEPAPTSHAEDHVSALARAALRWFGSQSGAADRTEMVDDDTVDSARVREVVMELCANQLGKNVLQGEGDADPTVLAHLEAAKRLERAIETSRGLDTKTKKAMHSRLEALRAAYQGRMGDMARTRNGEVQEGIAVVVAAQEHGADHPALRVLAAQHTRLAKQLVGFREQVEHVAMQPGGAKAIGAIDIAFQDAWRDVWKDPVTPVDIGPLEASLPRLRLLGDVGSGVARLVAGARASVQEAIDRKLPAVERAMKRAA